MAMSNSLPTLGDPGDTLNVTVRSVRCLTTDHLNRNPYPAEVDLGKSADPVLAGTGPRGFNSLQGACVWLTRLHRSGESTTAAALDGFLAEDGRYSSEVDWDKARGNLRKGLRYSKRARDTQAKRTRLCLVISSKKCGRTLRRHEPTRR